MTGSPQLSPERLARLLDEAVGQVTPAPGTLDRIRHGVRRRRWLRRAGAALVSAVVLGGGGATVLAVAPGARPAWARSARRLRRSRPARARSRRMRGPPCRQARGSGGHPAPRRLPRRPESWGPESRLSPRRRRPAAAGPVRAAGQAAFTSAMDSDDVTATGGIGRLATATILARGPAQTTGFFLLVVSLTTGATQSIPFTAT